MAVRRVGSKWIAYCDKCAWEAMFEYPYRVQAANEYVWHSDQPEHKGRSKR